MLNQKQKQELEDFKNEVEAIDSTLSSLGPKINDEINQQLGSLTGNVKATAKSIRDDINTAISRSNKLLNNQGGILDKLKAGQNVSKDIEKEIIKIRREREIIDRKIINLRKEGVYIDEGKEVYLKSELELYETKLNALNEINTAQIANRGITGGIFKNVKDYLTSFDKSGLSAKLLNGELNITQKFFLLAEAALIGIAKGADQASKLIADLRKNLGISYESARELQLSFRDVANSSEKLFITSKDLNKSFIELANTTGLISDFGGDTLITFTTLNKQLGLGAKASSQLALLARTQGEDTEGILENTVETVNATNRLNRTSISAKVVLNDIATASKSIVVSLGMSPEILAEAATEARALGLNLEAVDKIASSLLDFESSIASELEAEVLLGKEINLEKARQAALTNDLATLSQEIGENEGVINAFATGNRIQQEATAKALGLNRDTLAEMVMQQEMINLSQDEFINKYGEQSYQQMQAQSASEKFAATMEKIQGIMTDLGTIVAPILDAFASLVGYIAKSETAIKFLTVSAGALAAFSLVNAVARIFSSSMLAGPLGVGIGIAGVAALLASIEKAKSTVKQVGDLSINPNGGPVVYDPREGGIFQGTPNDGLMMGPPNNIGTNPDSLEQKRTNMLLEKLLAKDTNISMDGRKLNDSMQSSTVAYNIGV